MKFEKKLELAKKRHFRVRHRVKGTASRPRLSVHFSNKHVYAQCVDDDRSVTLCAMGSCGKNKLVEGIHANVDGAKKIGKIFGEKAVAQGINEVVFDRGARRYHGCVAAFADAAREAGLKF